MSAKVWESGYQTATMNNGLAMLTLSPPPSTGTGNLGPLLQRGNPEISQDLEFDLSPGTGVGGKPALV
jgi:hypothetical protein